jgi:hypothetical protein
MILAATDQFTPSTGNDRLHTLETKSILLDVTRHGLTALELLWQLFIELRDDTHNLCGGRSALTLKEHRNRTTRIIGRKGLSGSEALGCVFENPVKVDYEYPAFHPWWSRSLDLQDFVWCDILVFCLGGI